MTYLSAIGAPTVIIENAIGPTFLHGQDAVPEKESDDGNEDDQLTCKVIEPESAPQTSIELDSLWSSNSAKFVKASSVERFIYSFPVKGKHISFDGRLLHGAPSAMTELCFKQHQRSTVQTEMQSNNKRIKLDECENGKSCDANTVTIDTSEHQRMRVTFLVNIWLNHIPVGAIQRQSGQSDTLLTRKEEEENLYVNEKATLMSPTPCLRNNATCVSSSSSSGSGSIRMQDFRFAIGFGSARTSSISIPVPQSGSVCQEEITEHHDSPSSMTDKHQRDPSTMMIFSSSCI